MSHQSDRRDGEAGYPAEKARQGRIVLTTPTQRAIFIAGLAGLVLLVLFFALAT